MSDLANYQRLDGTTCSEFKIGKGGPKLKNKNGVLEIIGPDGNPQVLRAKPPAADTDVSNKKYVDQAVKDAKIEMSKLINKMIGRIRQKSFDIGFAPTTDSPWKLPANSDVVECVIEVKEPYNDGALSQVGSSKAINCLAGSNDADLQTKGRYIIPQNTEWPTGEAVRASVSGGKSGKAVVEIKYVEPEE